MQATNGAVPMYGGTFDLISTFSPNWPRTSANQVQQHLNTCLPIMCLLYYSERTCLLISYESLSSPDNAQCVRESPWL